MLYVIISNPKTIIKDGLFSSNLDLQNYVAHKMGFSYFVVRGWGGG